MDNSTNTVDGATPIVLRANGSKVNTSRYATLERFAQPSDDRDYNNAVRLIESNLNKMSPVKALFLVNLGSNQPELLIDARREGPASMSKCSSQSSPEEDNLTRVYVRATTIERFVDGVMDARYAHTFGHVFTDGFARVGIKFIDGLTPFRNIHPTLDRSVIPKLPKPTGELQQAHQDLKDWGYCLIKDALTPSELQKLQVRLRDQARAEAEAGIGYFDGGETKPNQRLWCLHNKGQEFIDLLDSNRVIKEFLPKFLGDDAILFSYTANIARPGSSPMYLHTDQLSIQPPIRSVAFGLNFMYFLTDVTPENGGTLVMPGSHRGELAPDDLQDSSDCVAAAGPAGTCMVFSSLIWHATGPNTVPGSERPVLIAFFMRPYIRAQENFFLSLHPEAEKNLTDRVKGFLGYRSSGSVGGVQGVTKDGAMVSKVENPVGIMGGTSVSLKEPQTTPRMVKI